MLAAVTLGLSCNSFHGRVFGPGVHCGCVWFSVFREIVAIARAFRLYEAVAGSLSGPSRRKKRAAHTRCACTTCASHLLLHGGSGLFMLRVKILSKGSASRIARPSLSITRSSVCADCRCLRINITVHQNTGKLTACGSHLVVATMLFAYRQYVCCLCNMPRSAKRAYECCE